MKPVRYTEDRILDERYTEAHPGPWIGKQRVYQTKEDAKNGVDWFHVREQVYDANGNKVDDDNFWLRSGLSGTRAWLQLANDEPILQVKKIWY